MSEDSWHQARLIPTSGINGADEQERRATSALLAVVGAVREFGRAVTQPLGAPAGAIETFIEVPFSTGGRKCYPDGLIRVRRGQRTWTALVEVKTGSTSLDVTQLETYLDVAREQGFDAVLTISNEIPATAGTHPVAVDKRKLRTVGLHHFSWSQLLAEAVMQKEHRGVADPDQAWVLGELIRYLEHPRSGALEFEDMGASWVPVREAVSTGTLRAADPGIVDVVGRFDALIRYTSLRLGRRLGTDVVPVLSRRELAEPGLRSAALRDSLAGSGILVGTIRIPEAIGPIVVTADLRSGKVTCRLDVDAPRDGRPTTRINWIVRQLRNAPEATRVEAFAAHARDGSSTAELLKVIREDPAVLVTDPRKEFRSFRIALDHPLGARRGRGRGSFIDSVLDAVDVFYAELVQGLKAWSAAPPRMRDGESPEPVATELISTSLSSQDGAELVSAEPESAEPVSAEPAVAGTPDAAETPEGAESPEGAETPEASEMPDASETPVVVDLREPQITVLRTVLMVEPSPVPATRMPPTLPSRREVRLVRQLGAGTGEQATVRHDAGWYQDPSDPALLRWWDGIGWSDQTFPSQSALA